MHFLIFMTAAFLWANADHCAPDGDLKSDAAKACYKEIYDNRQPTKVWND